MSRPSEPMPISLPKRPLRYEGLALAVVLHLCLAALLLLGGGEVFRSAGEGPGIFGGGGGGGSGGGDGQIRYVALAPPPAAARQVEQVPVDPPEVIPPPEPEPEEVEDLPDEVPLVDSTEVVSDTAAVAVLASTGEGIGEGEAGAGPGDGGGSGGGSGGGIGTGIGPGSGPGSGGTRSLARDPEPRQMVLPPEVKKKELRGTVIAVTFWVRSDGRVRRVDVSPRISDGKYASEFRQTMESYVFRPARSDTGQPVAGVFTIKVRL